MSDVSAIPPDILGSAIQAALTQREAAKAQEAERAAQSNAARTQARAVDEAASLVETSDNDAQVFTDAEGAGSQGRDFREPEDEDDEGPEFPIYPDQAKRLDIQA